MIHLTEYLHITYYGIVILIVFNVQLKEVHTVNVVAHTDILMLHHYTSI